MIESAKIIYKKTAEKNNVPIELIESIGNAVAQHMRTCLNNPDALAYELPNIGTFNIRFTRFEKYYNNFQALLDKNDENAIMKRDRDLEFYESNTIVMEKIKQFKIDKQEKRKERYETNESSEDNLT